MMIVMGMYRISGKYPVSDIIQTNIIISGWNFILIVASLLLQNFIFSFSAEFLAHLSSFSFYEKIEIIFSVRLDYPGKYPVSSRIITLPNIQPDTVYPKTIWCRISDINFTIWYIPSKNLLNLWQIWQNFFRFLYDSEQ